MIEMASSDTLLDRHLKVTEALNGSFLVFEGTRLCWGR